MLSFLFKKQKQVESLLFKYLDNLAMVQEHFQNAMNCYFAEGLCETCDYLIEQTHKSESRADDIRNEIITLMYSKVLIPESRGDLLGLLESIDRLATLLQTVLYSIQGEKLQTPTFLDSDLGELITISLQCCTELIKQIKALFNKADDIQDLSLTIDRHESHCDHLERRIIRKIFDSDLGEFQKLQLKELVLLLGEISDQAERVSRRAYIISIKRRV